MNENSHDEREQECARWRRGGIAGWWSQLHVVYKRGKEGAHKGMTGRGLLEINRNVTIFQWLLPYRARVFSRVSLPFALRASRRALCLFLSFSLYPASRDTCERVETRKQRVVTCAGCWKKQSKVSTEAGAAVMYIQGMKQVAGMVVKERRLCGEPAKGRNERSLSVRQAERSTRLLRILGLIRAWKF